METPVLIPNTEVKRSCGDDSPTGAKVACRQNEGPDQDDRNPAMSTMERCPHLSILLIASLLYNDLMSSWSQRRKLAYAGATLVLLLAAVIIPGFVLLYTPPSCSDGIQNGSEQDIDCGGSCERLCSSAFLAPAVAWTRFEELAPGLYNLAAYIINPNSEAGAQDVPFKFVLYDTDGLPITERSGAVTLPPHRNVLAFVSAVSAGNSTPSKALFSFSAAPEWQKEQDPLSHLQIREKRYLEDEAGSSLLVTLANASIYPIGPLSVYAVLYDAEKNAIGFSRTTLDGVAPNESSVAPFTWPTNRDGAVISIEVLPVAE